MTARALLDADMRTIGQLLLQGWSWWTGEMRAMAPERWRGGAGRGLPRLAFVDGRLEPEAAPKPRPLKPGLRAMVVIPGEHCLSRVIERPALNGRDLQRMLALEGDMLLPFPAETMIVAGRSRGRSDAPGRLMVEVAGLPIGTAQAVADAIAAARIVPVKVVMRDADGTRPPIDFAPAMRNAGLLPPLRSATPIIWGVVGLLLVLNLMAAVWRDTARVDRLEQLVQGQQPAVNVAQTISRRAQRDRMIAVRSVSLRRRQDAIGTMESVSAALPAGAWLQRYVWDGPTIRLAGYRPPRTDVATALRKSGRFAAVRSLAEEVPATVPAGEPFDLTARVAAR